MNKRLLNYFSNSSSDNLKSKIENRKWLGLSVIVFVLVVAGAAAQAQQLAKVPKIGWLFVRPAEGGYGRDMTRRALQGLGYVESKNITFEYRYADNKLDRLPSLADELVGLKVDLILAASANAAQAAKNATRTIPIVFVSMADPVVAGLVDSLPRPGGNLTGFTTIAPVLTGKRFELLSETIPRLSRVALLWNPKNPTSEQDRKESQLSARQLGQLHSMEVSSADNLTVRLKKRLSPVAEGSS
jgi:putative ABC transport system substrate-binding protein